jgi:hypothetical protein
MLAGLPSGGHIHRLTAKKWKARSIQATKTSVQSIDKPKQPQSCCIPELPEKN